MPLNSFHLYASCLYVLLAGASPILVIIISVGMSCLRDEVLFPFDKRLSIERRSLAVKSLI